MRSLRFPSFIGFLFHALILAAASAHATTGTWQTDASVGQSQVEMTVEVDCPGAGFICQQVDGYSDTRISTLSGSGSLEVDDVAGTLQFLTDGDMDLGFGPQPVYVSLSGESLDFDYIPFAGIPQFVNLSVFATAAPLISPSGFSSLSAGEYLISETVPYAALADVIGDLEFNVPDLVVPEQDVVLSGFFRVLGDVDLDGFVEYEIVLSVSLLVVQPAQIGGQPVQISVNTQLTNHFSGSVAQGLPVPLLGIPGLLVLAMVLWVSAGLHLRRR